MDLVRGQWFCSDLGPVEFANESTRVSCPFIIFDNRRQFNAGSSEIVTDCIESRIKCNICHFVASVVLESGDTLFRNVDVQCKTNRDGNDRYQDEEVPNRDLHLLSSLITVGTKVLSLACLRTKRPLNCRLFGCSEYRVVVFIWLI